MTSRETNRHPSEDIMETAATKIARQVAQIKVLIVDDEPSMRKVTRALLQAIGVKNIHEAADGGSGLDAIRDHAPDIVILDWEMPSPNGPEFMRAVRAPGSFPLPDVPVIMLTGHSERSRVMEAMRLGVNEYLLKPVSSVALLARIVSILSKPRKMMKQGDYYGPEPRLKATYRPDVDPGFSQIFLVN
jgi:two-component system, chemotaxis family, chemotaxis protein CheY